MITAQRGVSNTWLQARRTDTLGLAPAMWLFGTALLGSALLGATAVAAEPSKEPNWYQIELVVFTQPQQDINAEYWQEQLQPRFTPNAIQLRPNTGFKPQPLAEPSAEAAPEAIETALLALSGSTDKAPAAPPRLVRGLPQPLPQEYSDGAFTLLNKEQSSQQQELNTPIQPIDILQLERSGHRILFQGQWRQPVHEKEQARSIVIRGGQPLAPDYFELEGDIQLSLSRYLHLRPNLYLTLPLPPEWQARHPKTLEALAEVPTLSAEYALGANTEPTPASATAPASIAPLQAVEPPPLRYLTLPLDQPRRMRRNELHYIDHPLFGLLIRFTAYTPEPKAVEIPVMPASSSSTANISAAQPS